MKSQLLRISRPNGLTCSRSNLFTHSFRRCRTFHSISHVLFPQTTYSQTVPFYFDTKDGLLYRNQKIGVDNLHLDLVVTFDYLESRNKVALQDDFPIVNESRLSRTFQNGFDSQRGATLLSHAYRLLNLLQEAQPASTKRMVRFNKPRYWTLSLEDQGSSTSTFQLRRPVLSLEIQSRNNPSVGPTDPGVSHVTAGSLPKGTNFDIQKICLDVEPSLSEDVPAALVGIDWTRDAIEQLAEHIYAATLDAGIHSNSPYIDSVGEWVVDAAAIALAEKWPSVHVRSARVESLRRRDKIIFEFATNFGSKRSLARSCTMTENGAAQRVFIALGSNMGDKFDMIERACKEMESAGIVITRTSGLWETKAMYVEDQSNFLNGVCEVLVRSNSPVELLHTLQKIEQKLGRVKLIEKGPRCIDLDILLWGDENVEVLEAPPLKIPHISILEREFVLRPLCELIPHESLPVPWRRGTFETHLQNLIHLSSSKAKATKTPTLPMSPQILLCPGLPPLTPMLGTRKTHVMSVLNLTPDSFSDGGRHSATDVQTLRSTIKSHIDASATLIDIGGQSSRPGAKPVTSEEEISRILPAIKLIKELDAESGQVAISVDTYRADVAKAAIEAGAHIINDISAGALDPAMLTTVAQLGCTYILMHMRGTPETMTSKENTTYDGDIIQIVGEELTARIAEAERNGIRRWRIILDPGVGFAKTGDQNLEILSRFNELREFPGIQGMPWVVGVSRKGFIGKITGVQEARERTWGTAAAVTAAVQGGADVVRVHDVDEMGKVVKMADAIWRR